MKFQTTKTGVLTKYLMKFYLFDYLFYGSYEQKDLNENFKVLNAHLGSADLGSCS